VSDQYLGEIRLFAGNYAPVNWAMCNGQTLPINGNEALFALLGKTYGGDGVTNFGLPDLRGRVLIHTGTSKAGTNFALGQQGGAEQVALTPSQVPAHSHTFIADSAPGDVNVATPAGAFVGSGSANAYSNATATNLQMDSACMQNAGGGQSHANMMPFVVLTFIIALQGNYPSPQ
jgi:microcystin-dependent protein